MADTVETPLERELSSRIMRSGRRPKIRKVKAGRVLVREGEPGKEIFLLLDGELSIDVGGKVLAQLGPGAVVGERAVLETGLASTTVPVTVMVLPGPAYAVGEREELNAGKRTSTLTAITDCRLAVVAPEDIEPDILKQWRSGTIWRTKSAQGLYPARLGGKKVVVWRHDPATCQARCAGTG